MDRLPEYDPEMVKAVYELYSDYCFLIGDITKIVNGKPTIDVIANRIYLILLIVERYKIDCDENSNIDEIDIEENILTIEQIKVSLNENKKELLELFENYKKELSDKENSKGVILDIENAITIVEKFEEIMKKFDGKFKPSNQKIDFNNNTYVGKLKTDNN